MIRWESGGPYEVVFSTRVGGVSEGPYASLNLGLRTGDEPARVERNRRRLCAAVGAEEARLALNFQHHSAAVNQASAGRRGVPGDSLWTDEPQLPMLALGADCPLLALVGTNGARPRLAVVHAGWRGLLGGIVEKAAAKIDEPFAAVVGPAIGPCCYEVGEVVAAPFRERFGADLVRGGRLDLWTAAERALQRAGARTVERVDLCTACHGDLFFSERRTGKPRGVQGVIGLVT